MMLRDSLEKMHPGIYRYKAKKEIDHVFDSCVASIHDSMSIGEFYALTSFAIASMEDGHSNCRLPRAVINDFVSSARVFPAMVFFIHSHAYIFCCKQNSSLAGTELVSINGRLMSEIIQRLFLFIPSDAGIESRKNWEMPDYFQLFYQVVYGSSEHFDIAYKLPDGSPAKASLQADIIKNIFCRNPFNAPKKYLELTYYPNSIAVLRVQTFFDGFLEKSGENFHAFLDSAFKDLANKGTKKLLIDIRRNQGGNDGNGALLYSYLTQAPFRYYESLETVHEKFSPDKHAQLNLQEPQKNNFSGKVYILMDGRSFSASAEFASIARSNYRALFLGEENGGGYYGNTSGDELMLELPSSRISCRIPLIKYTVAVKKLPHGELGIGPDVVVYPQIDDFIDGKDSQMERALDVVRSR